MSSKKKSKKSSNKNSETNIHHLIDIEYDGKKFKPKKDDNKKFRSKTPKQSSLKAAKSAFKIIFKYTNKKNFDTLEDIKNVPDKKWSFNFKIYLLDKRKKKIYIYNACVFKIKPPAGYIKLLNRESSVKYNYLLSSLTEHLKIESVN